MKEALKLALEALQWSKPHEDAVITHGEAITAIKAALAQDETSSSRGEQEPVAWMLIQGRHEELSHWPLDDGEISRGWEQYPLYTTPPQRTEERNFCPRCGKRTADLTVIHTCTPPQPEQEPVAWMYVNTDGECEQIEYGEPFDDPFVTPLYSTPPASVNEAPQEQQSCDRRTWGKPWVSLTDEQKDILNFLFGLRAIDDVWFGDKHPTERGQYWWRNRLRKAFQEAAHSIKEKNT